MKTTAKRLRQAERELERRRAEAESTLRRHKEIAFAKAPALAELERRISESGAAAVGAVIGEGADIARLARESAAAQAKQARLLRENGFPADYLRPKFRCPACMDTGYMRGLRCECFTALLRGMAYDELCMDAPMELCTFGTFSLDYYSAAPDPAAGVSPRNKMEEALRFCREYARSFTRRSPSLLFTGPTGLGKTHLSLAIAQEVLAGGDTVVYGAAQNLLGHLEREHFARYGEQSGDTERALMGCGLLVLDDLGAEFATSFTQSSISNLVNTRLMASQPMIISTNLSMAQLNEKYGERVTSRIIGNYAVLRFFGADIRQVKRGREAGSRNQA